MKTVVRNLITLHNEHKFRDLLTYKSILDRALSRYENAAVKQAFHDHLAKQRTPTVNLNWS